MIKIKEKFKGSMWRRGYQTGRQEAIEEINVYLTKWLYAFANRPIKERENAYEEVAKIRKEIRSKLEKLEKA